ncbi:MAG: hypothetical protein GPJ52_04250 [Candidatus Heimdallarchaeota archaeon]|nr:hypothetical protein [Candidatus Heimdallarchaeota archaeon]
MTQFEYYDYERVSSQIEELEEYVVSEIDASKKVTFLRSTLLTQKNAMDLRYEAVKQLGELIENWPKLVVPVIIEFLETDESQFDDPNYIKAEIRDMIDPYSYQYCDYDEYWFNDLKEAAINALDPDLPETKEAIHVLIEILKKEFYQEYVDAVELPLLRLGEIYQDIRYLLYVHLKEEYEYNKSAKLIFDYLDEFYNQMDFMGEYFSEYFFSEIYVEENYK